MKGLRGIAKGIMTLALALMLHGAASAESVNFKQALVCNDGALVYDDFAACNMVKEWAAIDKLARGTKVTVLELKDASYLINCPGHDRVWIYSDDLTPCLKYRCVATKKDSSYPNLPAKIVTGWFNGSDAAWDALYEEISKYSGSADIDANQVYNVKNEMQENPDLTIEQLGENNRNRNTWTVNCAAPAYMNANSASSANAAAAVATLDNGTTVTVVAAEGSAVQIMTVTGEKYWITCSEGCLVK
ncbi:MAG: hypothetical protein PHW04_17805 [Candidatus Wallbacteria bacterium]|nr:hypothetical protein [Candidatus Wallbacteria bacterium]